LPTFVIERKAKFQLESLVKIKLFFLHPSSRNPWNLPTDHQGVKNGCLRALFHAVRFCLAL